MIKIGICADLHCDIMHDAADRLNAFVDAATEASVDMIIQLGDFCWPDPKNQHYLDIWNRFQGPGYHVMGNHDEIDGGFTWKDMVAYYGMPGPYYSFDFHGWHMVVVGSNYPHERTPRGYPQAVGEEQLEWLRTDLAATELPTVVYSHSGMDPKNGVDDRNAVRQVLEEANADGPKVVASFCGHWHLDYAVEANGIHHVSINSLSNNWIGPDFIHVRYSEELDKDYPYIKYTAPYRDPLYAIMTLDPAGSIKIEGTSSEWVGPSPRELGVPIAQDNGVFPNGATAPCIRDRVLPIMS